jgi:hypothetical protein
MALSPSRRSNGQMFTIMAAVVVVTVVTSALWTLLRASQGTEGISLRRVGVTAACTIGALVLAAVLIWVFWFSRIHIG